MSYKAHKPKPTKRVETPELTETVLTIPDALLEWAQDPTRQIHWPRPYGQDVATLVGKARDAPLGPDDLARLLARLDGIVAAALKEGRGDLLLGFDMQTAEWLALSYHAQTRRGALHVGPDPATRPIEDAPSPPWTYSEVRVVYDAHSDAATDLAWQAKELLRESFPDARIAFLVFDQPDTVCAACGKTSTSVMITTDSGAEYHSACWSEMIAPTPERVLKLLRKAPKPQVR